MADGGEAAGKGFTVGMAYQIEVQPDGQSRRFTYVSPSCEFLNGLTVEAVLADAMVLYGQILPEHRERLAAAEDEALKAFTPFVVEAPFRRSDGLIRWHRLSSAPRRLEDGRTLWDGFQIDITEELAARRRLDLAMDATGLGIWEFDLQTGQLYWSDRTRALFGMGPDEPVDFETWRQAVHEQDREQTLQAYQEVAAAGGGDFLVEHRTARPPHRWLLAHGRVLSEGGQPSLVLGTVLDITERKRSEQARDLLLGELNHRVKNDFQLVAAMLDMQARRTDSAEVRAELEKAMRRVMGVAQAHRNLYVDGGRRTLEMRAYLGGICDQLSKTLFADSPVSMRWDIAEARLPRDRAVAVGLIVNELVTNAVKHAFPHAGPGLVEVSFQGCGDRFQLTVADDGVGVGSAFEQSQGLGSSLIHAFADQAKGRLAVSDGPGARFVLTLD